MEKEYTVRPYQFGDEDGILKLLELVFDGWPRYDIGCSSLDHWKWKYLDNPSRKNFIILGVSGDQVIGVNHAIHLRIKIGEKTLPCAYVADTGVHPDFRRMGVLNRMRELKRTDVTDEDVTLNFFVSSSPIIIEGHLRKGLPRFPHKISNLVRIRDIDLQVHAMPMKNAWLMKLGFRTAKLINDVRNATEILGKNVPTVTVRDIQAFDDRIDKFWREVSEHYKFIVERTAEYLNWRFCDHRAGDYAIKVAEDERGLITGYCVLRINKYVENYPIGYIMDLLAIPGHQDAVEALVAHSVQYFDERGINLIICLVVKNHPNERSLNRHGFLDSRINIQPLYRTFKVAEELRKLETYPVDRVYFSYGDTDSLPIEIPRYR